MSKSPEFNGSEVKFPPIVSEKTLESIRSQYGDDMAGDNQTWGERLTELQEKIIAENPNLADFITEMANQHQPEMAQAIFEAVVGVLVLLERQTMSDLD